MYMKLRKGDNVIVITGKDKGKTGTIESVDVKNNKVLIKGINVVKRHVKKTDQIPGGVVEIEKPIHASKVMLVDPKSKKPTRIGYKVENGVKKRMAKVSGVEL